MVAGFLLAGCANVPPDPNAVQSGSQEIVVMYSAVSGLYEVFYPMGDSVKQVTVDSDMNIVNSVVVSLKTANSIYGFLDKVGYTVIGLQKLPVSLMIRIMTSLPTFVIMPVPTLAVQTPVKD